MRLLIQGSSQYQAGQTIGPACWPHHDLIIVTTGALTLHCGRRRLELLAHDAVLIPPGLDFAGVAGSVGCGIWVQHFIAGPDLPRRSTGRPGLARGGAAGEIAGALMRRLQALRERRSGELRRLRETLCNALLLELWQAPRGLGLSRPEAVQVQPAVQWAELNIGEARTLRLLAGKAGLSESHFRGIFRRLHGQPAGSWLRSRRLEEARRLLTSTSLGLKEIASRLGYGDTVSFNRAFARFHGLPPGRYRRTHPRVV